MVLPTPRAAGLAGAGALLALAGVAWPLVRLPLAALDALLLAAVAWDALRAPGPGSISARRTFADPMSAFASNRVSLDLSSRAGRPSGVAVADAPPASFDAGGHRVRLVLPASGSARIVYPVVPRARGDFAFGDLHLRAAGPWGLAVRQWRLPLAAAVRVYPDLRGLGRLAGAREAGPGAARRGGSFEGREFEGLRPHLPGDDLRRVDWKATARRGAPVVREMGPERSQTVWLVLDCGRPLSGRLANGRTRLDGAVDACLALARAAARGGDRVGLLAFGAGLRAIVPPGRGSAQLGPLAAALHGLDPRPEDPDVATAIDLLESRQRRRALVVLFTDLSDPEGGEELVSRAARLSRRHLVLVVAAADPALAAAASARPADAEAAYARLAAERILAEREVALSRLRTAGVTVESVAADRLATAAVTGYLAAKALGRL